MQKLESPSCRLHQQSSSVCDLKLWPMTLTFELDVDSVKVNLQQNIYVKHRSVQKVIVQTPTQTHTRLTALTGQIKWSMINVHTVKLLIIKLALFILPMLDIVILGNIAFTQRPSESRSRKLFSKVNKHTLS